MLTHYYSLMAQLNGTEILINVISYACALHAMAGKNVCQDKGLFESFVQTITSLPEQRRV